jgi:KUP system potassium uptake protein
LKILKDKLEPAAPRKDEERERSRLLALGLTARGVVYGDIGTSPLYAVRACFRGDRAVPVAPENVYGVLSLIFWSLVVVISVKYLLYVMRADNRGEGGILALMALIHPAEKGPARRRRLLVAMGVFGAALLYGDGTITPAISVLSAVEGVEVATPALRPLVIPLTICILVGLFVMQRRGTAGVGAVFGPLMMVWFVCIAVLGAGGIIRHPAVLGALYPGHAVTFFTHNGWRGFIVLGTVFLAVTGGEALYADMGHLGKRPIRLTWFYVVLPALVLNYFGQGALLLKSAGSSVNPFYHLAPSWALYPLVVLSTVATVIASQAVISGAFSLTRQAMQLGYCPRMRIDHTSSEEIGQIYVPGINWTLMVVTIALVIGFQHSTNLAAAYGVAVSTTMVITTLLAWTVAREQWGWPRLAVLAVTLAFLLPDTAFLGANLLKVQQGGWFPLLVGVVVYTLMSTWQEGRAAIAARLGENQPALEDFLADPAVQELPRVPGTAVFMTGALTGTPTALQQHVKHNKALHEKVVLLTVVVRNVPRTPKDQLVKVDARGHGFYRVIAAYGFMEDSSVPEVLRHCRDQGLDVVPQECSFYIGRETVIPTRWHGLKLWRSHLFALLYRNAQPVTTFFHIPHDRVIEVGIEVES